MRSVEDNYCNQYGKNDYASYLHASFDNLLHIKWAESHVKNLQELGKN